MVYLRVCGWNIFNEIIMKELSRIVFYTLTIFLIIFALSCVWTDCMLSNPKTAFIFKLFISTLILWIVSVCWYGNES